MSSNKLMVMNWQKMISPKGVTVDASTDTYGKFICEPLERGFGITIGNSLRRVILSSLYGAAIVSVKFDDVMHEFTAIDGVLEDVSELILNLKSVRLKLDGTDQHMVRIDAKGAGIITAADIHKPGRPLRGPKSGSAYCHPGQNRQSEHGDDGCRGEELLSGGKQ